MKKPNIKLNIRITLAVFVLLFVVLAGLDLAWVALAASARGFFRSRTGVKLANRLSATAMAGAAGAIALRD